MIDKKSVLRKIFFVAKLICGLRPDNNIQLLFATNKSENQREKGIIAMIVRCVSVCCDFTPNYPTIVMMRGK